LLQLERDKERDLQLAAMRIQLEEAKKESSTKRRGSRVSFSTGASSGGELADQAAKLAARAQRKAKKKANDVGVDMEQIRTTPGLSDSVEDYMQSVYSIPSLSVGSRSSVASQNGNSSTVGLGAGPDNSTIASMLTQQQQMMTNQMKMFMEFQQQQQLQLQTLMEKVPLQVPTAGHTPGFHQKSPSSAEKRAARITKEREDNKRRQAKIDSMKAVKKKCDDEYEAATKHMEKARHAKKKAERQLAGATESDGTDSEDFTKTVTQLDFDKLTVSSQFSEDSSETLKLKKAEKKRRQRERKLAESAESAHHSATGSSRVQVAPVPRTVKQGRTGDDMDKGKSLSIADWAKLCPVKYANSCTDKNINLPMWVWGKLAEIRAALAGNITPLVKGELEARLRHMQCVLEVCNQNSSPTDYTPYG
jgi:hypothetical protein